VACFNSKSEASYVNYQAGYMATKHIFIMGKCTSVCTFKNIECNP
jgi:hypothetical protein